MLLCPSWLVTGLEARLQPLRLLSMTGSHSVLRDSQPFWTLKILTGECVVIYGRPVEYLASTVLLLTSYGKCRCCPPLLQFSGAVGNDLSAAWTISTSRMSHITSEKRLLPPKTSRAILKTRLFPKSSSIEWFQEIQQALGSDLCKSFPSR